MSRGNLSTNSKPAANQQGQASIMIAIMMTTFLLFFAFVVNTGMLVNAKINLQSAADLAAYAGAAVQARQLTSISYLNYEMRRQYKKFLFRYYVVGGMNQKSATSSSDELRQWSPDNDPKHDYRVPAVCIIFNDKDNFCQIATLEAIKIPPQTLLDRINETLRDQLSKLEDFRRENCKSIGDSNRIILGQWLWNTDPNYENLLGSIGGSNVKILDIIQGVAAGLGLIPHELLLKRRIDTLAEFINFESQRGVTLAKANSLAKTGDVAAHERTLQAFYSAYNTLGEHTFASEDVVMDELLPQPLVNLVPINVGFDAYYIHFDEVPSKSNHAVNGKQPMDCESHPYPVTVPDQVPVGVTKDPTKLTYYSVRLQAKAKLLFSPFGELTLKAYAAAQPFGSRISPPPELFGPSDFITEGRSRFVSDTAFTGAGFKGMIPNLPIQKADSINKGWKQNSVIHAMFEQLRSTGGAQSTGVITIDAPTLDRAYHAAMVPNPWEIGKFNIINDLVQDEFVAHFDNPNRIEAFWAPLASPETGALTGGADVEALISSMIDTLLAPPPLGSPGAGKLSPFNGNFKDGLKKGLSQYITALREGRGENGEGFNTVRITDPFTPRPDLGGTSKAISLAPEFFLRDPKQIKTSWNDVKDGRIELQGRTGYSVKFVSFKTLLERPTTSNGTQTWDNLIPLDSDQTAIDLKTIQH